MSTFAIAGVRRRYDHALVVLSNGTRQFPEYSNTWVYISMIHSWAGRHDEALAAFANLQMEANPNTLVWKGTILARAGRTAEARAIAEQVDAAAKTRFLQPYFRAGLHAALGDREVALTLLEQVVRDGEWFIAWIPHDPGLDVLRSEPRFAPLLQRALASRRSVTTSG